MPIHRDPVERRLEEERYVARENNSAAGGLLLGITIAALLGLAGAAFYFMNQRQESPTQPTQILPIPVPNSSQPQSQPRTQEKNTTIIDRTIQKTKEVVPVPQQAPASKQTAPKAPDININVPNPTNQAPDTSTSTSPTTPQSQGADQNTSKSEQ
jgi:cytoskeletal protein RodZ